DIHTYSDNFRRMKCVFTLALVVMSFDVISGQGPIYPPGCPQAPTFTPTNCNSWCPVPNYFGQYYCCDSRGSNPGRCPNIHLTHDEIDLLCDSTPTQFPHTI
ncbi:hypothetical protein Pmani_022284, partial [Petrolisthes manimaculis]